MVVEPLQCTKTKGREGVWVRGWVEREKERLMESRGKRGNQNSRKGGKATAIIRYRQTWRTITEWCMCVREERERREGGKKTKKKMFAINLAGADAVYTQHREVRREASAVTAKIQHGCVFSFAFISWLRRSRFAVAARIMRLYGFLAHVRNAGRCRTYHAHRRPLAEQTHLKCIHTLVSWLCFFFFFSPPMVQWAREAAQPSVGRT